MDLDGSMYLTSSSWKEAQEAKRLAEEAGLSERNFDEAMKVRNRRYTGGYIAFESWMQKGENLVSDVPVVGDSSDHESPTSALEREQLRKTLSQFLRPKEMEALSWRYGLVHETSTLTTDSSTPQQRANQYLAEAEEKLFGPASSSTNMAVAVTAPTTVNPSSLPAKGRFGEAMSFHEVGKKMKVSAEYGRKLCHAGLAKLRQAAEDGRLEPALLF
jgi:DNA-directed RNA polymerase sigma subunit (sigma70/sigma32)